MSSPLLLDYLFLSALIRARLESLVVPQATALRVEAIENITQAIERSVATATAFVLWEGDAFPSGDSSRAAGGTRSLVTQSWTVLLAVRNAAQHQQDARNASAGLLLSLIHKAMAGWVPDGTFRPFVRTSGRRASYAAMVGLYPLTFAIDLNL